MSNSLFALVAQSQELTSQLIASDGELTPEIEMALKIVDVKLPAKIDAYAIILERMEMEEEYWKDKAKKLQAIAKGCENIRERMKDALKAAAQELNTDELLGVDMRFKFSKAKPKLVVDPNLLDQDYLMQVVSFKPDNERITEALKAGHEIQGAKLQDSVSIRTYAKKSGDR